MVHVSCAMRLLSLLEAFRDTYGAWYHPITGKEITFPIGSSHMEHLPPGFTENDEAIAQGWWRIYVGHHETAFDIFRIDRTSFEEIKDYLAKRKIYDRPTYIDDAQGNHGKFEDVFAVHAPGSRSRLQQFR